MNEWKKTFIIFVSRKPGAARLFQFEAVSQL